MENVLAAWKLQDAFTMLQCFKAYGALAWLHVSRIGYTPTFPFEVYFTQGRHHCIIHGQLLNGRLLADGVSSNRRARRGSVRLSIAAIHAEIALPNCVPSEARHVAQGPGVGTHHGIKQKPYLIADSSSILPCDRMRSSDGRWPLVCYRMPCLQAVYTCLSANSKQKRQAAEAAHDESVLGVLIMSLLPIMSRISS